MPTGLDPTQETERETKRGGILILWTVLVFAAVFCFSLCLRTSRTGFVHPAEALLNLYTWMKYHLTKALDLPGYLEAEQAIRNGLPLYFETIRRFTISVLTFLAGGMLAVAGAVYQGAFRNPIAAPTVLGVAGGVNLGFLLTVLIYGGAAYGEILARYRFCYFFALLMLAIVLAAGKMISGLRNRPSLADMLLVGVALSSIVGVIESYVVYEMEAETLRMLTELRSGMYINTDAISFLFIGAAFLIGFTPIFLLRNSFNAICFSDDEAYAMGVNPALVRYSSLVFASLLMVSAMVHVGSVGMISLIVPHICRYFVGVNFKRLLWGCFVYGGLLLLICRAISALISFGLYGEAPITTVVSILAAPVFVIVVLQQRRGWE